MFFRETNQNCLRSAWTSCTIITTSIGKKSKKKIILCCKNSVMFYFLSSNYLVESLMMFPSSNSTILLAASLTFHVLKYKNPMFSLSSFIKSMKHCPFWNQAVGSSAKTRRDHQQLLGNTTRCCPPLSSDGFYAPSLQTNTGQRFEHFSWLHFSLQRQNKFVFS